jgi:hypothetical protein
MSNHVTHIQAHAGSLCGTSRLGQGCILSFTLRID